MQGLVDFLVAECCSEAGCAASPRQADNAA
jgi:hypothetical protein